MERGDIVLGWLTRVVLVLAVLGLLVFDGIAVAMTRVSLEQRAGEAAEAAAQRWQQTRDGQQAYDAALATVLAETPTAGVVPGSFVVDPDGSVALALTGTPTTLVLHHLPPLREALALRGDGRARPAP